MGEWKGKIIMWFSLAKMALKTGTHIYQNKQKSKLVYTVLGNMSVIV